MSYIGKLSPTVGNGLGGMPERGVGDISAPRGEITFGIPGTYSWTPPKGVASVCVVCVGGGGGASGKIGGGGGALVWRNTIAVAPGDTLVVTVGDGGNNYASGQPSFVSKEGITLARAEGGASGSSANSGGSYSGAGDYGGGSGGGSYPYCCGAYTGGGGAGGYSGKGGDNLSPASGGGASGGGGGNYGGGGGTGVSLFSQGSFGSAGNGYSGGIYGGGSGAGSSSNDAAIGGHGACRIIWGEGRAFPSTDCGQS